MPTLCYPRSYHDLCIRAVATSRLVGAWGHPKGTRAPTKERAARDGVPRVLMFTKALICVSSALPERALWGMIKAQPGEILSVPRAVTASCYVIRQCLQFTEVCREIIC